MSKIDILDLINCRDAIRAYLRNWPYNESMIKTYDKVKEMIKVELISIHKIVSKSGYKLTSLICYANITFLLPIISNQITVCLDVFN